VLGVEFGKIFISHSSADKPFVRRLAKRLEQAGYSVPQVSYVERFEGNLITAFVELGNLADEQWQAPLKFDRDVLTRFAEKFAQS
jgi:hypothetical protein